MEVQRPDGQLYQVGHIDFPPFTEFDAKAGFDGGIQSAAKASAGTITSQQDTTVNGNPARDFTWNGTILGHSIKGRGRFISAGRRLHQILWIAPTESTPGDVDRFFNSFQFTTAASSPAATQQPQPTGETSPGETRTPFPPLESSGELTLDRKKQIFSDWMDIKKFADSAELENFPEDFREQVKKSRERHKQVRTDSLLRRYGITAEQLTEIEVEGRANNWPSSP
jgi:hypothetical protein